MQRVARLSLPRALAVAVMIATSAPGISAAAAIAGANPSTTCPYELVADGDFSALGGSLAGSGWVVTKSDKSMACDIVDDGTVTQGSDGSDAFYVYNPKAKAAGYCILSQNLAVNVSAQGSFLTHVLPRTTGTEVSCQLTTPDNILIQLADAKGLTANNWVGLASQVSLDRTGVYKIACSFACDAGSSIRVDDVSLIASTGGNCTSSITALGCRTEGQKRRALIGASTANDNMTVEECASFCSQWQYFGLEYGRECYCGEFFHRSSRVAPDSECDMACQGNRTQTCGGSDRLNTYRNVGVAGPQDPSQVVTTKGNSTYYGCYTEAGATIGSGRTLSAASFADDQMTLEGCENFCGQSGNTTEGYPYAFWGVEYGRECYCGNVLAGNSIQIGDEECELNICGGNPAQACGGPLRLATYQYVAPA